MRISGRAVWVGLVRTALVLSIAALAGGYLGALHPAGDSLAVGRAPAAGAVAVLALLAVRAGLGLAGFGALMLALVAGVQVGMSYVLTGPPGQVVLYQKNLRFDNAELVALEADIRDAAPEVLTLQEVSDPNLALLKGLQDLLPHQLVCPFGRVGGTGIATRLTPVAGATLCAPGLAAMQVLREDRPIWLVSVHLHWPWPYRQADQLADLLPVLAGLDGPVLMAGDFNMVRWGASVTAMARVAGVVPAGPSRGTYLGFEPWQSLPIDHVFAPQGGRIALRGAFGSDHLGLLAGLAP
jgi:endonuclease/exonuclease/phosphatase (EEP) superfamily protein YafD